MFSGYPEILSLHLLAIFITLSKSSLGMLFIFGVNDFFLFEVCRLWSIFTSESRFHSVTLFII